MQPAAKNPEREKWNRRYREEGPEDPVSEPTPWLLEHRHLLAPGPAARALDLACGRGRNALYLARLGYAVDALDISDVAVAWLGERAARDGLAVEARRCDLRQEVELAPERYDVVLSFRYLERRIFPAIRRTLAPGGLLVFESFTRRDAAISERRLPPEILLEEGELGSAFPDLLTLAYRETELPAPGRGGRRAVASLVARRPKRLVSP